MDTDEDTHDEVTSPEKATEPARESTSGVEPAARRDLNEALSASAIVPGQSDHAGKMPATLENNSNLMLIASEKGAGGSASVASPPNNMPPLPPAYVSPRELKKAKKGASPTKSNQMALLAGFVQERRQAQ